MRPLLFGGDVATSPVYLPYVMLRRVQREHDAAVGGSKRRTRSSSRRNPQRHGASHGAGRGGDGTGEARGVGEASDAADGAAARGDDTHDAADGLDDFHGTAGRDTRSRRRRPARARFASRRRRFLSETTNATSGGTPSSEGSDRGSDRSMARGSGGGALASLASRAALAARRRSRELLGAGAGADIAGARVEAGLEAEGAGEDAVSLDGDDEALVAWAHASEPLLYYTEVTSVGGSDRRRQAEGREGRGVAGGAGGGAVSFT